MKFRMRGDINYLKILDAIIEFVAVLVMDVFATRKVTAEMKGRYMPMFEDIFASNGDPQIAIRVKTTSTIPTPVLIAASSESGIPFCGIGMEDRGGVTSTRTETKSIPAVFGYLDPSLAFLAT